LAPKPARPGTPSASSPVSASQSGMLAGLIPRSAMRPSSSIIFWRMRSTCTTRLPTRHWPRSLSGVRMRTCSTRSRQRAAAAAGKLMAPTDPRRHPTFAFDLGDLHYGRGLVSFARALVSIGLGYRFAALVAQVSRFQLDVLTLELDDKTKVDKAREHILAGL